MPTAAEFSHLPDPHSQNLTPSIRPGGFNQSLVEGQKMLARQLGDSIDILTAHLKDEKTHYSNPEQIRDAIRVFQHQTEKTETAIRKIESRIEKSKDSKVIFVKFLTSLRNLITSLRSSLSALFHAYSHMHIRNSKGLAGPYFTTLSDSSDDSHG